MNKVATVRLVGHDGASKPLVVELSKLLAGSPILQPGTNRLVDALDVGGRLRPREYRQDEQDVTLYKESR